ncbi:alpha/beta hydrolase [Chitinimonas sp. BJYL2]|uniref:alpha/beta hydrolase n=1 Tax=Chitinimonas sp. BJYL2 TaxID=2976696 RepID=UPI0022B39DD5|nr:alpha/beta fold hydrolase [Chitinimonas sp. BJYL2]
MNLLAVFALAWAGVSALADPVTTTVVHPASSRQIPLAIYTPSLDGCQPPCRAALFGTGYTVAAKDYSFIGNALAKQGYLTIIVQHDLEGDAPMPNTGNIAKDRGAYWRRGADALAYLLQALPKQFPAYQWQKVTLMGHSQGGDIAALYTAENPQAVAALVTLDNRRVPLPQNGSLPVLTLRSADQPADAGVLPAPSTQLPERFCRVNLPDTKHNDMNDHGTPASRQVMQDAIIAFLQNDVCRP